nr:MAG TPA: hypothetical protein [Caudoviricetes sp.]
MRRGRVLLIKISDKKIEWFIDLLYYHYKLNS